MLQSPRKVYEQLILSKLILNILCLYDSGIYNGCHYIV